jgi:MFS family permease
LIAARILQGITGALMFPQVYAIIQVMFPPRERHIAFGIFGAVLGAASFAGNLLGGLIIDRWGWRPVFLINLPLGIFAIAATMRLLRESRAAKAVRLDLGGVALATIALLLLIYPLIQGREAGWPAWTFLCMAASLPMAGVFLLYEKRVLARGGFPLVDLGLFHDRVFVLGLAVSLAVYGAMATFFLTFTVFLQEGLSFNPTKTGWIFAPFAIGFLVSSTLAVRLTSRLGSRIINIGLALMMAGIIGMITLATFRGASLESAEIMALLVVYGLGQGLTTPTLLSVVLSGIPTRAAGSASGVLTTVQQIAQGIGIAAVGTIFFGLLGKEPAPEAYPFALATALTCNGILLAAAFGLVLRLPRNTGHTEAVHIIEV